MTEVAPAGWYPDPENPQQQRYWDGAAWTQNVAPISPSKVPSCRYCGRKVQEGRVLCVDCSSARRHIKCPYCTAVKQGPEDVCRFCGRILPVGDTQRYVAAGVAARKRSIFARRDDSFGKAEIEYWRLERLKVEEERRKQQEEKQAQKVAAFRSSVLRWRETEPFPVGGVETGVFSPYAVEMTAAETILFRAMASRFDPYCIFVDTYLERENGGTAQLDIIAVCKQGVVVVESKGLSGLIHAGVDESKWTQVRSGGSEPNRFYNPIKQNASHMETLIRSVESFDREHGIDKRDEHHPLHTPRLTSDGRFDLAFGGKGWGPHNVWSLVVFDGGAQIKDLEHIPPGCFVLTDKFLGDVLQEIFADREALTDDEILRLAYKIRSSRLIPDQALRDAHVRGIKQMLGTDRLYQ